MTKNNISALKEYLFEQLDAVTNGDLKGNDLNDQIKRSKAVSEISKQILEADKITLEATKLYVEHKSALKGSAIGMQLIGTSDEE